MSIAAMDFKCGTNAEDELREIVTPIGDRACAATDLDNEADVDYDIVSDEELTAFLKYLTQYCGCGSDEVENLVFAFSRQVECDPFQLTGRDRCDFVTALWDCRSWGFDIRDNALRFARCIRNEDGSVKSSQEQGQTFDAWRDECLPRRTPSVSTAGDVVPGQQSSLDAMLDDLSHQEQTTLRGVTSAAELDGPDRALPEFLIEQLILEGFVNAIWGDGFVGKTTLAIYMAVAIAAGVPLFGRAVKKRPVLLVLAEDPIAVVQRRLRIVCEQLGVRLSDLRLKVVTQPDDGEMIDFCLATIDNRGHYEPGPYLGQLSQLIASAHGDPVFVVLDTASQFAELDEDERLAVTAFTQKILGAVCHKYKATILLTAHPSAAQMRSGRGTSGSTAWRNSVRNMLVLQKSGESRRRLTSLSNFIRGADIALSYENGVFELDDGKAAVSPTVTEKADAVSPLMAACVALAIELADKGTLVKRPRGAAGYKEMPPAFYSRRKVLFGTATPRARAVWDALDGAVDAGYLDYRPTTKHTAAGYFKGSRSIGEPALW